MIRKTNWGYYWFERKTRKNWFLAHPKKNIHLNFPEELLGKRVMLRIEEFEPKMGGLPKNKGDYYKIEYPKGMFIRRKE